MREELSVYRSCRRLLHWWLDTRRGYEPHKVHSALRSDGDLLVFGNVDERCC